MIFAMLDKIPFLHRDTAYNIIIEDDISFDDLHALLDNLGEQGAFDAQECSADLYYFTYGGINYTVGVDGQDVLIVIK